MCGVIGDESASWIDHASSADADLPPLTPPPFSSKPTAPLEIAHVSAPTSEFLAILQERGFIHQCSDLAGLDAKAKSGDLVAYIGFDCTARSLHVGSLLPIMLLRWLQKTGGKPTVLVGGGTTRVGDPSGKDESRKLLSVEDIEANKTELQKVFASFLGFGDGATDAVMVDNADWLTGLKYIDFLRDVGRHFSVNRMLSMDSVKLRLDREHELSFLEFNYMILPGLRFCRAQPPAVTAWSRRWAAQTSGATSSPASTSAAAWARPSSTP